MASHVASNHSGHRGHLRGRVDAVGAIVGLIVAVAAVVGVGTAAMGATGSGATMQYNGTLAPHVAPISP